MRSNLFWLNDEQWQKIEPFLPTDVRGKERVDDRRVISGILHVLKSGCRWCDCPPRSTARPQRFAIGLYGGRGVAFGKICFASLPIADDRRTRR
jgi:transposase